MELIAKTFDELTTQELFDIYKLRTAVFIVEQNCPYQEVDEHDLAALHVWFKDSDGIAAYMRILPRGCMSEDVAFGRVIAARRRCGLGTRIVSEGLRLAREHFNADCIYIEAQNYARGLYEKLGFRPCSEVFDLDGIPHIEMKYYY